MPRYRDTAMRLERSMVPRPDLRPGPVVTDRRRRPPAPRISSLRIPSRRGPAQTTVTGAADRLPLESGALGIDDEQQRP